MSLEDFLKQCVLLRLLVPITFYVARKGMVQYSSGTIMLGTRYQQWTKKTPIYKPVPVGEWNRYELDHYEMQTHEAIQAYPYLVFLDSVQKKSSLHLRKSPFAPFDMVSLKNFALLYPEINKTIGAADFSRNYSLYRFSSKTVFNEIELENKDGKATIKVAA